MTDFYHLSEVCKKNTKLSAGVVDDFLIYYAAKQNRLETVVNQLLSRYRHITRDMPKAWINTLKSQYIAHRIFKKDGLLRNYLHHSALKNLDKEEKYFLEQQLQYPWRFSFSAIAGKPADNFFNMEDVFSGDPFLLFSPGIADIEMQKKPGLWFNLIAFNGACWQTFGPIAYFKSFEPDDIFFFATEMHPHLESEEDILDDMEQNHIPYSMLFAGGDIPPVYNKNDRMVLATAEYQTDHFDTTHFVQDFRIDKKGTVCQLQLKQWNDHPHFAMAYYDEEKKSLLLTAATDRGFDNLSRTFIRLGYPVLPDPDIRVNLTMLAIAEKILKKKISPDRYAKLFEEKPDPKKQEELDKLNTLLNLALPEINSGRSPDIEALAKQAGVDAATAAQILEKVISRVK